MLPEERILKKIYDIHNHSVMLDRDLAELYGVETRTLNQAVKRNNSRFPDDFMFQLTREAFSFFKITNCDIKLGRNTKAACCFHIAGHCMA